MTYMAQDRLVLDRMEIEEAGAEPSALAAAIHAQLHHQDKAVPIHAIAAALDIVEIREAPTIGFEGALIMTPDRGQGSIAVNARSSRERQRFTIAHELGHFLNIWHRPTNPNGMFTCRIQDLAQPWSQQNIEHDRHRVQETEANRFAIELLAPRSRMRSFLKGIPDLSHVTAIADRLDLSRESQRTSLHRTERRNTGCGVQPSGNSSVH
jgi:Zn-dependent peptidase ImmA (M78 family)